MTQTSLHGIHVNVVHRRFDRCRAEQVAVKARSCLPESEADLARTFRDQQPLQQRLIELREPRFDPFGKWRLESRQISADLFAAFGQGQKVHVLGHEHERDKCDSCLEPGSINTSCQLRPPGIVGQQRGTVEAGKCQLVQASRFVVVVNALSIRHDSNHFGPTRKVALPRPVAHGVFQGGRANSSLTNSQDGTGGASGTRLKHKGHEPFQTSRPHYLIPAQPFYQVPHFQHADRR